MTMIDCLSRIAPVSAPRMEGEPLQRRARTAGLSQKVLASLLCVTENTASLQLRGKWASGTPRYVIAAIVAWELLSHDQRQRWLAEIETAASLTPPPRGEEA